MTKLYKIDPKQNFGVTRKYDIIISPVVTEKSNQVASSGCYVFLVDPKASKFDIKVAIESLFNVKVSFVNVVNRKGKNKVFKGRKGVKSDTRRAFVKLADGQSFDFSMGV